MLKTIVVEKLKIDHKLFDVKQTKNYQVERSNFAWSQQGCLIGHKMDQIGNKWDKSLKKKSQTCHIWCQSVPIWGQSDFFVTQACKVDVFAMWNWVYKVWHFMFFLRTSKYT